jgi:succinate dehydrogenase/fumarate reductase flavoprotein subunit
MASGLTDSLELDTDVLVIGGGLAGTWAAVAAARAGASAVLVDKGFRGTSGLTLAWLRRRSWLLEGDYAGRQ